ncbi:N,N-dimethylformamidase beta subunit family domain-containing protein [Mesorhizobium sp. Pch-S]|uniref:N,N-dimethylformamidase beta subunit family domain-containing protein n=1 Tax=Mesorhizobium sp. Pch-S TaxID=2082387 RepID=UPI001010B24A|nr:N,N-dimethylformamidase beta subunit family domain-containing protein [Mesorhizobium sp. Pch-S]QAZ45456.1 large subunit of N,N-dimethylformamidase [Mesorhizobium sp. Pch-S]
MLKITAYADRISCFPGETVDIKVSATGLRAYDAELRRIIQGDINPDGPGYRDELIEVDLGGPFVARKQAIRTGSYGLVDKTTRLCPSGSFTLAALIWPTLPGRGRQAIIATGTAQNGCSLFLDDKAMASVALTTDDRATTTASGVPCRERTWYVVVASYDVQSGRLAVSQTPVKSFPNVDDHGSSSVTARDYDAPPQAPFRFGAVDTEESFPGCFFNGKIENPRIYDGAHQHETIVEAMLGRTATPAPAADWDFAAGMRGDRFSDRGPHRLDGRFLNLPHRAVSGCRWNSGLHRWTEDPASYAAVHFHDDDLYDAGWQTDFTVTLPHDLKSGVYAVRLFSHEDRQAEYFVVLAVRARHHRNDVVFVLPTASYMAYANHRLGIDVSETEIGAGQLLQLDRHHLHLQQHPEYGLSLYEVHNDGSGVFYSSRLRPILDFQPKVQGFIGGSGSNIWQFNADTHILGFLEDRGIAYDVLTDEDLDREGVAAFDGYRAVLTGSHPEYTSTRMLDAYQGFLAKGGRVAYLGGNGFYWRIAYSETLPGVIECRRAESGIRGWEPGTGNYWHQFTDELGGLWRRIGRAPQQVFGVGMTAQGFDLSSPYLRNTSSHDPRAAFIFDGIKGDILGDFGLNGGGAAGNEIDRADFSLGTPPHALVLASSRLHTDIYLMTPEDLLDPTPTWSGTQCDLIRADMVFFETQNGGAVFSTGSIAWAGAMAWNGYDNHIAAITENVIRRFAEESPFG